MIVNRAQRIFYSGTVLANPIFLVFLCDNTWGMWVASDYYGLQSSMVGRRAYVPEKGTLGLYAIVCANYSAGYSVTPSLKLNDNTIWTGPTIGVSQTYARCEASPIWYSACNTNDILTSSISGSGSIRLAALFVLFPDNQIRNYDKLFVAGIWSSGSGARAGQTVGPGSATALQFQSSGTAKLLGMAALSIAAATVTNTRLAFGTTSTALWTGTYADSIQPYLIPRVEYLGDGVDVSVSSGTDYWGYYYTTAPQQSSLTDKYIAGFAWGLQP